MDGRSMRESIFWRIKKQKKTKYAGCDFPVQLGCCKEKSILKRKMSLGLRGEEEEVEVCIVCCV